MPTLIEEYLRSVMLIPVGPWVDVVYWTLGVEIAFYSLVALVLVAAGGHRLTQVGLILGAARLSILVIEIGGLLQLAATSNLPSLFSRQALAICFF